MTSSAANRCILPPDPTPLSYELCIEPDVGNSTFAGVVTIHLHATGTHEHISLNCAELNISDISFQPSGGTRVSSLTHTTDTDQETITVTLPSAFSGDGALTLTFAGAIRRNLFGFYCGSYKSPTSGGPAPVLATQFCPVSARTTFPCWDEPARKAVFHVSILAPAEMQVLFNTPARARTRTSVGIDGTPRESPLLRWDFAPTPRMSTYILAWAIGEFEYMSRTVAKTYTGAEADPDGVTAQMLAQVEDSTAYHAEQTVVSIWTTPGKSKEGGFALDIACKTIALYERLFGCNYPLPKLDIFAAPDFAFGGMENWGLILCRETAILCDRDPVPSHMCTVATIVAHEVSHMWFGDLVTMAWWKELWLNESFATYVTNLVLHRLHPEWGLDVHFVYEESSRALTLDALRSSHPIEMEIASAKELDGVFDAISYAKGGCVLRMVMGFLGEEVFFKGVRTYIARHRYGNASTGDLWRALGEAAGRDVSAMMSTWTGRMGFPYVVVTEADAGGAAVELAQHCFLCANDPRPAEAALTWEVPLTVGTGPGVEQMLILSESSMTLPLPADAAYVMVNSNRTAFCRVLYSAPLLQRLVAHLPSLSVLDRFGLLSDYAAFARGGHCSTSLALSLIAKCDREEDLTVLSEAYVFVHRLRAILTPCGEAAVDLFNAFVRRVFTRLADKLGYRHRPGDSFTVRRLRADLFAHMVTARHTAAIDVARELLASSPPDASGRPTGIPGDQRSVVFAVRVSDRGEEGLAEVMRLATTAEDAMDRANYLRALAAARVENAVPRLVSLALSDAVRTQDMLHLLDPLASSPQHSAGFVRTLMERWSDISAKAPGVLLGRIVNLTRHATDAALLPDMRSFLSSLSPAEQASIGSSFKQAIESVEVNAAWVARDAQAVFEQLSSGYTG